MGASKRQTPGAKYGFAGKVLFAVVLSALPASAQTQRGEVTGVVTDSSGALIPNAKVNLASAQIGAKFDTLSNASGVYTIPLVPYGRYEMTVTAPGFATYTRPIVEVATGTTNTVNVVLTIGEVTQEVTVAAGAVVLESNTSSIGTAVDEKLKTELPNLVNGDKRSPFSYIFVSPTVNPHMQLTIGGSRSGALEVL